MKTSRFSWVVALLVVCAAPARAADVTIVFTDFYVWEAAADALRTSLSHLRAARVTLGPEAGELAEAPS